MTCSTSRPKGSMPTLGSQRPSSLGFRLALPRRQRGVLALKRLQLGLLVG
jgi:hypothetical protein